MLDSFSEGWKDEKDRALDSGVIRTLQPTIIFLSRIENKKIPGNIKDVDVRNNGSHLYLIFIFA